MKGTGLPFRCYSTLLAVLCCLSSGLYAQSKDYYLVIGGYSNKQEISVYRFNSSTAALDSVTVVPDIKNPSYLCFSPDNRKMYSVGELDKGGAVNSFSFNSNTGQPLLLQSVSSGGAGSCNITTDNTGKWLFVSNYTAGSFSVLAANNLGKQTKTFSFHGKGKLPQQDASHIHSVTVSKDNKHVYIADLGTDSIYHYLFNAATGKLTPAMGSKEPAGSGPRHFTIAPDGNYAYCIHELSGTVSGYKIVNGNLKHIQTISSLPADYTGRIWAADIHITPNGRFLYASNRAHESIAAYSINKTTGKLTITGFEHIQGKTPRNFTIDPTGKYLLIANQDSDNVLVYTINPQNGSLHFTGTEIHISKPSCLKLVPVAE